jgi:ankyrin repeat protein
MKKRILLGALLLVPMAYAMECPIGDITKSISPEMKSDHVRNVILQKTPLNLERHEKIELLNHYAYEGDVQAVKKILTVKAKCNAKDLNTKNLMGITPWQSAQESGNEEIKNLFINAGAKTDTKPAILPPLHKAVYYGDKNEVSRLLAQNKQALEQSIDFKGSITPLYIALWNEDPGMEELLLENGADKNFGGNPKQRFTPLYTAARFGHTNVVKYLLDQGADPNKVNKPLNIKDSNYTPLSVAARKNEVAIVRLLLAAGADVNQINEEGQTPLAIAEQFGNTEIENLLREHGATK